MLSQTRARRTARGSFTSVFAVGSALSLSCTVRNPGRSFSCRRWQRSSVCRRSGRPRSGRECPDRRSRGGLRMRRETGFRALDLPRKREERWLAGRHDRRVRAAVRLEEAVDWGGVSRAFQTIRREAAHAVEVRCSRDSGAISIMRHHRSSRRTAAYSREVGAVPIRLLRRESEGALGSARRVGRCSRDNAVGNLGRVGTAEVRPPAAMIQPAVRKTTAMTAFRVRRQRLRGILTRHKDCGDGFRNR